MTVSNLLLTLTTLLLLCGCSNEKQMVTSYLEELENSKKRMESISLDLDKVTAKYYDRLEESDPAQVKDAILVHCARMKAESGALQKLEVPERTQALHEATVKQYEISREVVLETLPAIELGVEVAKRKKEMQKNPKRGAEILKQMESSNKKLAEVEAKVGQLVAEGEKFEKIARQERKKLQESFGLVIKTSESP